MGYFWILLVILITMLLIGIMSLLDKFIEYDKLELTTFYIIAIDVVIIEFICFYNLYNFIPSAIDVYRNKTELKVKGYYKDNTFYSTDTIVIYKNK